MNWKALKNNRCPNCGELLVSTLPTIRETGCATINLMECDTCDFRISKEKFEKIVNDLYKPKKNLVSKDNMEELNNLGHKKITEDFSDSAY